MRHLLTLGGWYERNNGTLAADFIYTDEDLFGFPDISYVNPVIPRGALWQHDESSRVYNLGITGLFGQYILEPTTKVDRDAGGRYDRLALDATVERRRRPRTRSMPSVRRSAPRSSSSRRPRPR